VSRRVSKRRNVKSDRDGAANGHERAKDFLTTNEMEALLEALKGGRHGVRDYLLALMTYRKRCSATLGLSALQDGWSGCQFHGINSSMRL
jgi:hypothetical protein